MKRPLTFLDGVGTGISASALLVLLWLASQIGVYEAMYRDLGNAPLPALTRIVLQPFWRFGVPALVIALDMAALYTRVRHGMFVIALVTIAVVAVTYHGMSAPLSQLAGSID